MKKSTDELFKSIDNAKTFDDFFKEEIEEFIFDSTSDFIQKKIKEKGLKRSDIIKRSNLAKQYAYQIIDGRKPNPSRNKLLMIAVGMGLNFKETQALLNLSKQSPLYPRDPRDSAIIFSLKRGENIIQINEQLEEHGLDILE